MAQQQTYKWDRVGQVLTSKETNEDGTARYYMKLSKPVNLKEGQVLYLFKPTGEKTPAFVKYDVVIKNA